MALSSRKKVAIGFWVTSALFAIIGGIVWNTTVNPTWLTVALPLVVVVADAIGLAVTVPQLP